MHWCMSQVGSVCQFLSILWKWIHCIYWKRASCCILLSHVNFRSLGLSHLPARWWCDMTLMDVLLHVYWRGRTLLECLWNSYILADCVQIKLGYISATALNLILMVSACVGRLCGHAHLCSWVSHNHSICTSEWRRALLHFDLLSLHLAAISLNCLSAVCNFLIKHWHLQTLRRLNGMIKNWILPMPTAWASIYLIDGLLNPCHVDHRLLSLIWSSWGDASFSIGLSGSYCGGCWEMHVCCLGWDLPSRIFLLPYWSSDLLLNCRFFLSLNSRLMIIHKDLMLLNLILSGDTSHVFLKNSLVQCNLP